MMSSSRWFLTLVVVAMVLGTGCGGPRGNGGNTDGDADPGDSDGPLTCTSPEQCRSGICEGGMCVAAQACTEHGQCAASQYCHFPSTPNPWVADSPGECAGACSGDDSCGIIGQECHEGRCYTNIDCTPANNSADCPPGEVCNGQSRTCKWPPEHCDFQEQCPAGWICNVNGECVDPDALGGCSVDGDCSGRAGCEAGCECFDNSCRVTGGCDPTGDIVAQCGAGFYCASGTCRPATACTDQATCTPYGLVCTGNFCINPPPCVSGVCEGDWECKTNFTPPACFPPGSADCVRDDLCPPGEYCNLFLGSCEPGCRNDAECAGQCPGSASCYCQGDHSCSDSAVVGPGEPCTDNGQCSGGTVCSYNDVEAGLTCGIMPMGDCTMSCRQVCDTLMSQVMDTCPAGEKCGGDDDLLMQLVMLLFGSMMGEGSTASVCYPTTAP